MKFAIIENEICVNVIIANAEFAAMLGAIEIPEGFGIGDGYKNGEWISNKVAPTGEPTYEPTIEEKAAAYDILTGEVE